MILFQGPNSLTSLHAINSLVFRLAPPMILFQGPNSLTSLQGINSLVFRLSQYHSDTWAKLLKKQKCDKNTYFPVRVSDSGNNAKDHLNILHVSLSH